MAKEELHQLVAEGTDNESNIRQICAIKDGKTVYSDCWRGFAADSPVHVASVTKGIMAVLTGIAIDRGYINSTQQKVLDFFPDYAVKRGEKTIYDVKIAHLLTMTAPYKYRSEPWTKVCTSGDWTKAALDLLGGRSGITGEFKYSTLGIQILAGIIENASGEKCIDFANRYLFAPLDIPEVFLHTDSSKEDQFEFFMSKLPRKREWYSDPCGTVTAGWGICLSACDMAKIGAMVINGGEYNGKRIVSSEWISRMTSPLLELGERFGYLHYGYLWYRPYKDRPVFAAIGDCGNIIYANAEKNISVGMTGYFKPRIFDRIEFIEKNIIPMLENM